MTCDHGTGMVAMIQQGTVSFLHPKRTSSDSINSNSDSINSNILNQARQFLHHHVSPINTIPYSTKINIRGQ